MLLRSKRRDASEDISELPARKRSIRETVANTLRNTQKRPHTNEIAKMKKQLDVVPDPMEVQLETNKIAKRDKLDTVADTMPPHQTNEISKVNRLDVVADPKKVTVTWQIENQDDEELANVGDYEPSMEGSKTTSEALEEGYNKYKEASQGNDEQIDNPKNVRGRSKLPPPLSASQPKLKVTYNEAGQHLYQEGDMSYPDFLGHVARNFIPINFADYRLVPDNVKLHAMKIVRARYVIDNERDSHNALRKIGSAWKIEKMKLRKRAESLYPTIEERIQNPLDGHDKKTWEKFILQTTEEKFQMKSKVNKESRSKKQPHYTGRCSLAQVHEKLKKENPNANRCDVLKVANTSKDGKKIEIVEKLEAAVSSGMTGEEAILHVLGPERYGRIRGVGFGISPTVYQYIQPMVEDRKKFVADVMEQADKRVKLMVEQMLEEKFQSIEKMIPKTPTSQPSQPSQPSVMQIKDITSPETPFQESEVERGINWREDIPKRSILHLKGKAIMGSSSKVSSTVPQKSSQKINDACRRCILFQYHEENIVAEGTVINTSPDAVIHNQPIEKGCYVVSVDKALNKTAYLCHPTLEFKKVVDAEKSFVQWPSQFITML